MTINALISELRTHLELATPAEREQIFKQIFDGTPRYCRNCGEIKLDDDERAERARLMNRIASNRKWWSENFHLGKEVRRSCEANIDEDKRKLAALGGCEHSD